MRCRTRFRLGWRWPGARLTLLWIAGGDGDGAILRREMDEVFDSALARDARHAIRRSRSPKSSAARKKAGTQGSRRSGEHEEYFTYMVRDAGAGCCSRRMPPTPRCFPPYEGTGFARPLPTDCTTTRPSRRRSHRGGRAPRPPCSMAREMQLGLGLPLLVVIPLSLAAIILAVRLSFYPVRRLRDALAARAHAISPPCREHDCRAKSPRSPRP